MARFPIVGLVIRANDGHGLERALHFALDEAERRIDDAPGNEWFDTSPNHVKEWYQSHIESVTRQGRLKEGKHSQDKVSGQ